MKKLFLFLTLLVCTMNAWAATTVTINGKTLSNESNYLKVTGSDYGITNDGEIVWRPADNSLTLAGVTMEVMSAKFAISVQSDSPFSFLLVGENTINLSGKAFRGLNLWGEGSSYTIATLGVVPSSLSVSVSSTSGSGAAIVTDNDLTIDFCNLTLEAPEALSGDETLRLKDVNMRATGSISGSVVDFSDIFCEGCKCRNGEFVSKKGIVGKNGELLTSEVYFFREYPIVVQDTVVTDLNKDDILRDGGSVSYSEYGYNGGFLALTGGKLSHDRSDRHVIEFKSETREAHLWVIKDTEVTGEKGCGGIYATCPLTIYANDPDKYPKLTVSGSEQAVGIECLNRLTIQDVDVIADGTTPLKCSGEGWTNTLTFSNAYAMAIARGDDNVAVEGFGSVEFSDCCVAEPSSAVYDNMSRTFTHINYGNSGVNFLLVKRGTDDIPPTLPTDTEFLMSENAESDGSSYTLTWAAAEDNLTIPSELKYQLNVEKVYPEYSLSQYELPSDATSTVVSDLEPNAVYVLEMAVTDEAGNSTKYGKNVIYPLYVDGIRVTSQNCKSLNYGLAQFDNESTTLTLSNYFKTPDWENPQSNDYAIVNYLPNLTIKVIGPCGLDGTKGAIYSTEHLSIVGTNKEESQLGAYILGSDYASIYAAKGLTVETCYLILTGNGGLEGGENLELKSCHLSTPIIKGFNSMTCEGCYVKNPVCGVYNTVSKVLSSGQGMVEIDVPSATDMVSGDVNGNYVLEVADIISMLQYLKPGAQTGNVNVEALDLNGDGKFTEEDVKAFANKILGKKDQ